MAVLIIFSVFLQTIISLIMLSIGGINMDSGHFGDCGTNVVHHGP